eukprot:TRINITY_DN2621_c0_g1_i2.p1 TRINITY_DN2621_c0_g1~~TRINITY_DN2621_c0_g1_i2.p1  ORF type:complete len:297 (+),score=38.82 TRINITY_DN2621_c0_g1_i2:7-897(+)
MLQLRDRVYRCAYRRTCSTSSQEHGKDSSVSYSKAYYANNKQKKQAYYLENKERLKMWREENKQKKIEYDTLYRMKKKSLGTALPRKIPSTPRSKVDKEKNLEYQHHWRQKEKRILLGQLQTKEIQAKLETELGIETPQDWYKATMKQFKKIPEGGKIMLAFDGQLYEFLKAAYPSENWKRWMLKQVPKGTWNDRSETRSYLEYLEPQLHIVNREEDWYRVSRRQLLKIGAGGCLMYHGRISQLLSFAFPEIAWNEAKFSFRGKKASQKWLLETVYQIFNTEIIENYLVPSMLWGT